MEPIADRSTAAVAATQSVLIPEILDVGDAGRWLRCSPGYVRGLLREGHLAGRRVGRHWIITRKALLAFLESRASADRSSPASLHVVSDGESNP